MRVSRWCHFAHRHSVCCQKSGSHDVGLDLLSSVPVMENVPLMLELFSRKRSDGALGNERMA